MQKDKQVQMGWLTIHRKYHIWDRVALNKIYILTNEVGLCLYWKSYRIQNN